MSAALDRLTAAVENAVSIGSAPNDDDALNALSDKLEAVFPLPVEQPAPVTDEPTA